MAQNLLDRLPVQSIDQLELLHLLEDHFGMGGRSGENEFVYPSSLSPELKARFEDGRLVTIDPGVSFSAAKYDSFADRVQSELVESSGDWIGADVAFASRAVNGWFRSGSNDLQILPAPPEAARPLVICAEHPFVVEFTFRKSSNNTINWCRYGQGRAEIAWVLNALLRSQIQTSGPRQRNFWALVGEMNMPPKERFKWVQEFYMVDGFRGFREDLSECASSPLQVFPHAQYYENWMRAAGDELSLPESLSDSLAHVKRLSGKPRERFMRACQWLQISNRVWEDAISLSFVAMVIAIESLIEPPTKSPKAKGPKVPGATKRFEAFTNEFGPKANPDDLRTLYEIRSDLAHGWLLFQFDEAPWSRLVHHPNYLRERGAIDQISFTVRQIFVNWLRSVP
jgi:Apea-like HEPN